MQVDDEQLIEEIRKRRSIYVRDRFTLKTRDRDWQEIANALDCNEAECQKRWKNLRDKYVRYSKKRKEYGQLSAEIEWHLYDQLSFLEDHIEHRGLLAKTESESFRNDVKLLEEIRKNEILWNTANPRFYSIRDRNLSWLKVAYVMRTSEEKCRLRWNALRAKLSKKLKRKVEFKEWNYAKHIEYVIPHMRRHGSGNNSNADAFDFHDDFDGNDNDDDDGNDNEDEGFDNQHLETTDDVEDNSEDGTNSHFDGATEKPEEDPLVVNEISTDTFVGLKLEEMSDSERLEDLHVDEDSKEIEFLIEEDMHEELEEEKQYLDFFEAEQSDTKTDTTAADNVRYVNKMMEQVEQKETKKQHKKQWQPTSTSKPATVSTDPFYAALGVFFEKINPVNATQYKMDVLNYAHKRFNELQNE